MRMLIGDGVVELGRWEEVTGLGRGVDSTGRLSDDAIAATIPVLSDFGRLMDRHGVVRRRAIATSASRDASNRESFFDLAEVSLGVRPDLICGEEEARLAYTGATTRFEGVAPYLVCDIGGGSTELVTEATAVSVDIGSVRLTERALPGRPVPQGQLVAARALVAELLSGVEPGPVGSLIGVAGTWTELPGLARGQDDAEVTRSEVTAVVEMLAAMTVEDTARLPTLNPKRAPVILGGAVIAEAVMHRCLIDVCHVTIHDTLDGVLTTLLD
jgi:exopolyphosphatase/guanosine-5'-triphosphate,3'-diphosphate pyrophosphatase